MNRDEIIDLTMATMLDIIPLISNIDNEVNEDINATLVSIYERNMAMLSEHLNVSIFDVPLY